MGIFDKIVRWFTGDKEPVRQEPSYEPPQEPPDNRPPTGFGNDEPEDFWFEEWYYSYRETAEYEKLVDTVMKWTDLTYDEIVDRDSEFNRIAYGLYSTNWKHGYGTPFEEWLDFLGVSDDDKDRYMEE